MNASTPPASTGNTLQDRTRDRRQPLKNACPGSRPPTKGLPAFELEPGAKDFDEELAGFSISPY
jgi:hypothetical protein